MCPPLGGIGQNHVLRTWFVYLLVLVSKLLATAGTTGSGAVGGVFTPTLFVGAAMGALYGTLVHNLGMTSVPVAAYTVVGMGAFLAATTHAPLMSILMLFEMTESFHTLMPLSVACVLGFYSARELSDTAQLLNRQYAGQALTQIARNLEHELHSLQSDIAFLMSAAVSMGAAALNDSADAVVIAGARHLLGSEDLAADLASLRKLFDLFEQKTELLQLLNLSREAQGMRLFIGEESGVQPLDGCSVVTAPYSRNGQVLGTLGGVGPTRMAYKRVIPIVEITARLVTSALAQAV